MSRLRSTILGSELVIETPNDPTSFGVVESLLGALEAFLATSDEADLLPHRERTIMVVSASDQLVGVPEIRFCNDDSSRVEIVHPADLMFPSAKDIRNFVDWLKDSVVAVLSRLFIIRDIEPWMDRIAGQERSFSRALMLGDALTLDRNVFGDKPKPRLADWLEPEDKVYQRLRDRPWRAAKPSAPAAAGRSSAPPKPGSGPPPPHLFDRSRLKHTERRIISPIDMALWDRAKWGGTLFGEAEGGPPLLGIMFENGEAGEAIFRAWRERWGREDAHDALRVAIITGLSTRNPAHYAVTIGPNLNQLRDSDVKMFVTISRIKRMEVSSSANLDRFLAAYRQFGGYFLVPAIMGPSPSFLHELYLAKRHLHIRQAWQIGENDVDAMALNDDDDPIIPPIVLDPPVNKALAQLRAFRDRGDRSR